MRGGESTVPGRSTIKATNVTGTITALLRCTSRGLHMQATAHATSSRLQGRAENATREKDEEQRYDALQDGRSGEHGLPGECAQGEERRRREERGKKELGREGPHEPRAAAKRKVTPKRWHVYWLYWTRERISLSVHNGPFRETYKSRSSKNYLRMYIYIQYIYI